MKYDIVLCGVGGQGVLSLAAIVAEAAVAEGFRVRQSEVHGMAQRGGAVLAHLRISDAEIHSDLIPGGGADMILSMEPLECLRYTDLLSPQGVCVTAKEAVINIPAYPDINAIYAAIESFPRYSLIPALELAKKAGGSRSVNMVLVGAASKYLPLKPESLENAIKERFASRGEATVQMNIEALRGARERPE
jgi:indolepyruvate ferredoxin oxidoreductase beta subunit